MVIILLSLNSLVLHFVRFLTEHLNRMFLQESEQVNVTLHVLNHMMDPMSGIVNVSRDL